MGEPSDNPPRKRPRTEEVIGNLTDNIGSTADKHGPAAYGLHLESAQQFFKQKYDADECPEAALSDFEFSMQLGSGCYGTVYLSRYKDGQVYALKQSTYENALEEKRIIHSLESPFIVEVFFAFRDDKIIYIALELAPRGALSRHITCIRDSRSEQPVKLISAQVVLALEYMHECRVAHRDLKCSNIVLFEDGYVKLCDFGIAMAIREDDPNQMFRLTGKRGVIAPEQIKALLVSSLCSDWWMFGMVIRDLLPLTGGFEGAEATPADSSLSDFLRGLFHQKVTERLGVTLGGAKNIKEHPWYRDVDFRQLYHKNIPMLEKLPPEINQVNLGEGAIFSKKVPKLVPGSDSSVSKPARVPDDSS
ncbi:cAMP-dependent protein kinase catalytic subunit-like [Galendromus occidentalis]|uniref:cAMP-dependent protein kinase catalytic subunit-like n=1 Tax=Galendromus occidentalis TaxID=34638 RepID=A0AAJ6VVS0_9ACAR|nr:cAMP-dependent protein kinase catalytic subunit-like [Galendromus occidentalis]